MTEYFYYAEWKLANIASTKLGRYGWFFVHRAESEDQIIDNAIFHLFNSITQDENPAVRWDKSMAAYVIYDAERFYNDPRAKAIYSMLPLATTTRHRHDVRADGTIIE